MIASNLIKNAPINSSQNIPIELLGQCSISGYRVKRRYIRAHQIQDLAISHYNKNGKPITYADLLSSGIAHSKKQSQNTLKRSLHRDIVFTLEKHKPQQYYPTCLKSEILSRKLSKNAPLKVTGVGLSNVSHSSINSTNSCSDSVAIQSLKGYVLPLLPSAALHIHKMQFKLKITPDCYAELGSLSIDSGNKGKEHVEIIGNVRVSYRFYANGTVMVFTESSNNPFKLEDDIDRSSLIAFFGQLRDRLVTFLADTHERIVPGILEWELTQCDINKDIKVGEGLQYTGLKLQVKHFDRLFRVYIKSLGKDTACRVEESLNPKKKPAVQAINEIFANPNQRVQEESSTDDDDSSRRKITEIHDMLRSLLLNLHKRSSSAIVGQELVEGRGSLKMIQM